MKTIFVDTAAFIALGNNRDQLHEKAKSVRQQLAQVNCRFITSRWIIAEFCNAFSAPHLRSVALQQVDSVSSSLRWKVLDVDDALYQDSLNLYRRMMDKAWGLVDCSSILVCKKYKVSQVFTADHHFEQAGFEILLK